VKQSNSLKTSLRPLLAAGGVLLVVGIAAVGVSVAQAQSTPTPNTQQQNLRDRYTQALANRLHVSVDQLKQAVQDARKDVGLPDAAARPARPGPGPRPGVGRPPFERGVGFRGLLGQQVDALVTLLKTDRATLLAEVPGKTLAEVAQNHGVTTQAVVDTITKTANDQIDRLAQARNLPADRVTQLKQRTSERVQEFVTTHRFPARGTGVRS
jgi:hypothetical protein